MCITPRSHQAGYGKTGFITGSILPWLDNSHSAREGNRQAWWEKCRYRLGSHAVWYSPTAMHYELCHSAQYTLLGRVFARDRWSGPWGLNHWKNCIMNELLKHHACTQTTCCGPVLKPQVTAVSCTVVGARSWNHSVQWTKVSNITGSV